MIWWRMLVIVASVGVVGAATHANVIHAGGYQSSASPLIITVAALLAIGMGYVGIAFNEGRRRLSCVLFLCLLAGEAYWFGINAEREIAQREVISAPAAEMQARYAAARDRFEKAEQARRTADIAAFSEAAKPGCVTNCKAILIDAKNRVDQELSDARDALARMAVPRSAAPLPDRLGIAAWAWDLLLAGLRSVAVIGASIAIGMAAHPRSRSMAIDEPARTLIRPASRREHVSQFLRSVWRPDPEAETVLRELYERYPKWCAEASIDPLPPKEFGPELRTIIDAIGLETRSSGSDVIVRGAALF
jgi:hypothetical protein